MTQRENLPGSGLKIETRTPDYGEASYRCRSRSNMNDMSIPMSLPLDEDGFLRRECPDCERQFKWWPTPDHKIDAKEMRGDIEAYFCPNCHDPAPPSSWWTTEQVEYMQNLAVAEALGPQLRGMKNDQERSNRRSKWISLEISVPDLSRPEPLIEPNDMVRVDLPCHPEEPLKVEENLGARGVVPGCGIQYPVDVMRALPESKDAG
jgi:hypothetical protein